MASRYIRAAVEEGYVKLVDARAGCRRMRYVPFWAAGRNSRRLFNSRTEKMARFSATY